MKRNPWIAILAVVAGVLIPLAAITQPPAAPSGEEQPSYAYFYHDQQIVLEPSANLIAVRRDAAEPARFMASAGWERDPLSDHSTLAASEYSLYRLPPGAKEVGLMSPTSDQARLALEQAGLSSQPVFEQGGAILIPTAEVIVAFERDLSSDDVRKWLADEAVEGTLADPRPLRPRTYIVEVSSPEDGRAFAVSRILSALPGVSYAEPNLLAVPLREPRMPEATQPDPGFLLEGGSFLPVAEPPIDGPPGAETAVAETTGFPTAVDWVSVLTEGFEAGAPGWSHALFPGSVDARPAIQSLRRRSGSYSIYMTGGGPQGVPEPGPYPNNVNNLLFSPMMNLAAYQEAYIEFWFYAHYENPASSGAPWDYGRIGLYRPDTGSGQLFDFLAVAYTGDLTADPTTQNGWRRVLFRVPPAWRIDGVQAIIQFFSDAVIGAEGLYIDDVRVVGTTDVDAVPIGLDAYSGRQYELNNSGQIAGLGNDTNDLNVSEAWSRVVVSDQIVVAVIDNGVDLTHPDLNLVTGYNGATGAPGGGPVFTSDNHGTACAGNVGAIADNIIGVAGTAPGVKIMPIQMGQNWADFARSIDLAVQHGAHVLSNSWGWVGTPSAAIESSTRDALDAGRTVLFAAGNGPDRPPWSYATGFPCNLTATSDLICVGASSPTDEHKNASSSDGKFYWGSSYVGAGPDVVAPGPWSYTTDRQGSLGYNQDAIATGIDLNYTHDFGGTSSSTPKVAGIAALMLSVNPDLTPSQVKTIMRNTARDIDAPGIDDRTGAGRVDALAAIEAVIGASTYTLTVNSAGATAVAISASPSDYGGTTDYAKSGIPSGTSITLTAPPTGGSAVFSDWDGCDTTTGTSCVISMISSKTVTVNYTTTELGQLAVDFGPNGVWHYNDTWRRLTPWNPGSAGVAGWSEGLAADFDAKGLWGFNGITWRRLASWNASEGLAGWSGGLAAGFDTNGLWSYNGTAWKRLTTWNPGSAGVAGWSEGLAADFDAKGLWGFNGTTWRRLTSWNAGEGLAGWSGGLAADFDANGLWSYDGTAWKRLASWNAEAIAAWSEGIAADFGANGLWSYDGAAWRRLSTLNPGSGGLAGWGSSIAADFGANGLWSYDGTTWRRLSSWDAEAMDGVNLN